MGQHLTTAIAINWSRKRSSEPISRPQYKCVHTLISLIITQIGGKGQLLVITTITIQHKSKYMYVAVTVDLLSTRHTYSRV
jgi:hypothetical protein